MFLYLSNIKSYTWNHKRVYRELEFNRTVRYDWLSHYIYSDITESQDKATDWLWTYNNERHNMDIGGITPIQELEKLNNGNSTDSLH